METEFERRVLAYLIDNERRQRKIMADLTALNTTIAGLQTTVQTAVTDWQQAQTALNAAHEADDTAGVAAANATLQNIQQSLLTAFAITPPSGGEGQGTGGGAGSGS